jgi:hypothetical protein
MPSGFDNAPSIASNLNSNISGIISSKPTAKYASGARTILRVNGKPCGFAFGISWSITTDVTEIQTIDDYFPAELAPRRISVDGTISALHIPGQSVGVELWQPDALNFLFQQYITIEARDTATDQLLFYTSKAVITSRREDIRVDQLANVQLSFKAIGFQDERKPEQVKDANTATSVTDAKPPSRLQEAISNVTKSFGF